MRNVVVVIAVFFAIISTVLFAETAEERSWGILKAGLAAQSEDSRAKAADALGLLQKNQQARQMAEAALNDPSAEVRAEAAAALGQIGLRESVPKLKEKLQDKETTVVFSAAAALYAMGDPTGYNVYYAVLTGQRKTGDKLLESQLKMLKDPEVLGRMGFEMGIGFIPFGGLGYKAFKTIRQDNVTPVRAAAAQKLAHDPDPKSAEALIKATADEKWLVRASAVSAIALRGDAKLLYAITPRLDDPDEGVRYNSAAAVLRLTGGK